MATRALLLMTKPALPGRVKTRLAAALGAETAACLHAAFLADLAARLRAPAAWDLVPCWALEPGETMPAEPPAGRRQRGADLGERLLDAFARLPGHELAAAIGSDLPELGAGTVEAAFAALERGADVVLGPARDGGYYLIALRPARLRRELFEAIPWSTERVLSVTRARCRALSPPSARRFCRPARRATSRRCASRSTGTRCGRCSSAAPNARRARTRSSD